LKALPPNVFPYKRTSEFTASTVPAGLLRSHDTNFSLFIGMVGYHVLEGVSWIDAFLNASMLLGGMGPVTIPVTFGGKLFAGLYALYCGLAVILVAGVILAPVAHRILHTFHMESRDR
jgi:hypothetical protein